MQYIRSDCFFMAGAIVEGYRIQAPACPGSRVLHDRVAASIVKLLNLCQTFCTKNLYHARDLIQFFQNLCTDSVVKL